MTKEDSGELPAGDDPLQPEPALERRMKPIVHPSAPAPLPKDYGEPPQTPLGPQTPPTSALSRSVTRGLRGGLLGSPHPDWCLGASGQCRPVDRALARGG